MRQLAIIFIGFVLMGCGESLSEAQQRIANETDDPFLKMWGAYMTCEQDTDCIIATGVCSSPVAINKGRKRQFSERVNAISQTTKCAAPPEYDLSKVSTSCEANFCALKWYEGQLSPQSP